MKLNVKVSSRVKLAVIGQKRVKTGTVREVNQIKHNIVYRIQWDGDIAINSHNYLSKHVRIFPGKPGFKSKPFKDRLNVNDLMTRIEHMQIKSSPQIVEMQSIKKVCLFFDFVM
jgi:hypothetical protein